jgi:hypothetical protein
MKKNIQILTTILLLNISVAQLYCQNILDLVGPELVSIELSDSIVDVSDTSQTITILLTATDYLSGVSSVYVEWASPNEFDQTTYSEGQMGFIGFDDNGYSMFETVITIESDVEPGVWDNNYSLIFDNEENNTLITDQMPSFEVIYSTGCTNQFAYNFNQFAIEDDGSCVSWNSIVNLLGSEIDSLNSQIDNYTPDDGIGQSDLDAAHEEGIASVDITSDNQSAFDQGVASVMCPDIITENISLNLPQGWSIFGYTCLEPLDGILIILAN